MMAGGLHLEASSINFPTRKVPATPIPKPRAAPVKAAVFSLLGLRMSVFPMILGEGDFVVSILIIKNYYCLLKIFI